MRLRTVVATAMGTAVACLLTATILTRPPDAALLPTGAGALLGAALGVLIARMWQGAGSDQRPVPEPNAADGQHELPSALLTALFDGVVILDASGGIMSANRAALRLVDGDGPNPDALGRLHAFLQSDALAESTAAVLNGVGVDRTVELAGGGHRLRLHGVPSDHQTGGILVLQDLTESRRLDRVRQEFVANASHELLTPIGTVRALADALARGGLDDRKIARRFLKQLRREADRLTDLAHDLVDLAQAQADELHLELKATDVSQVVAIVLDRLQARADKAGVLLSAGWQASPPPALADATRLEQVLVNLVQNAIKFTPRGGRVTIAMEERPAEVVILVSDTGIGIPAQELPRIFERFYKVRGGPPVGGTGLGLAIVRHLVGAMRGEVRAVSEPGQGSTFEVALRRADVPEPLRPEAAEDIV